MKRYRQKQSARNQTHDDDGYAREKNGTKKAGPLGRLRKKQSVAWRQRRPITRRPERAGRSRRCSKFAESESPSSRRRRTLRASGSADCRSPPQVHCAGAGHAAQPHLRPAPRPSPLRPSSPRLDQRPVFTAVITCGGGRGRTSGFANGTSFIASSS
ncbi:hypothetical protein V5799_016897 [Amblyomma americanum]|uniref:Uncharacterized protein n=1 Tax=Amblyomma americanum TaxID=6943 RepID=A0AAQ4F4V1_AMBAM